MLDYPVIDADGHITESTEQLRPYLRETFGKRGPWAEARRSLYAEDGWDRSLGGRLGTRAADAKTWLKAMDEAEVETTILYPTAGLGIGWVRETDFCIALCQAYNNFFHEEFYKVSPRLRGVALIPLQEVPEAVKELRRAVTEMKFVGAMMPAVGFRLPLGHKQLHPVYEEAERLGCTLAVHATVRGAHFFGADQFDQFIEVHTLSHPFAQMMQLTSIIFQGIPEKFPRLKLSFMESGCTWVPFWIGRMDEEYELRGEVEAPLLRKKPSAYVKSGNIFFHAEADEILIAEAARVLGEGSIFYASDWPHWDSNFPKSIHEFRERRDLSEELKRKILYTNAQALYGLS